MDGGFGGWRDDRALLLYIAVFWWLSGYINTCCYVAAPRLVAQALAPRAGVLMALVFQASCLLALLVAEGVQVLLYSGREA